MSRLDPRKLHVTFASGVSPEGPMVPRAYTLTHSDSTGELFLTVGFSYDRAQIAGWYTRVMRDEVLAEWRWDAGPGGQRDGDPGDGPGDGPDGAPRLVVHCHVSGGLVVGPARWRYGIFRRHMPMVLEAFRHGDGGLLSAHPELDSAAVLVRFHSTHRRYDRVESWGRLADYRG